SPSMAEPGSAMLGEFDIRCADKDRARDPHTAALERVNRRVCVLREYEAALGAPDFAVAIQLELSAQVPMTAHVEEAPIFAPTRSTWGSDELFVRLPIAQSPSVMRP